MSALFDHLLGWLGFSDKPIHIASLFAAFVMTYLPCHPIVSFVRRGWRIKKEDVLSSLNTQAKKLYLCNFLKLETQDPDADFNRMYELRYGRYRLITPTAILVAVLLPLSYLVADSGMARIAQATCGAASCPEAGSFIMLPPRAVAAFAGSYMWIAYGLIMGAARYNLPPSLLMSSALRLLIAAPMGYAIGALAVPGLAIFLAFAIGAFPLDTIKTLLQRTATTKFNLNMGVDPNTKDTDQVIHLDGVDPAVADLLQDAGVTTVPQLAYCDPVQLSMLTNLGFDTMLDLVNQALAWLYLGETLAKVRPYGLRGASEIGTLLEDLRSSSNNAEAALGVIAQAAGLDPVGLRRTLEEIAEDPYTLFLDAIWQEAVSDERASR